MAKKESALLFAARGRRSSIEGDGISLEFDLIVSESHKWNLRVATHVVEDGSPFSDHIRKELRKGNMVGMISNFGLNRGELDANYAQEAFDLLEYYSDNAVPVTIVTTLKVYENYIITQVGADRSNNPGEKQEFPISFQEFRTVKLQSTGGITEIKIPSEDLGVGDDDAEQASPNSDVGEQEAEEESDGKLERFINFTDFASGAYK